MDNLVARMAASIVAFVVAEKRDTFRIEARPFILKEQPSKGKELKL